VVDRKKLIWPHKNRQAVDRRAVRRYLVNAGADLDSTGLVRSELRAEALYLVKTGKTTSANNQLALAA